jgi:phage baseplate assembly protein gpV
MSDMIDIIRAVVRDELRALRLGDLAVVQDVFPHADGDAHNHECNVKLREGELELRKVPIATPHIGMVSTPRVGDLVLISYVGGDPNRPIIIGRLYTDEAAPPVHEKDEWRVHAPHGGEASIAIDKDQSVVITAGGTTVTIKKSDVVAVKTKKDLTVEADGNVQLKCQDCRIEAAGNIDLGDGGGGVITDKSHKCYYTGAPLVGSTTVKAKG